MSYTPPRRDLPQMLIDEDPIIDWDTEKAIGLWMAVTVQAIKDAWGVDDSCGFNRQTRLLVQDSAREWFRSDRYGVGSYFWICDMMKQNPEPLRRYVLNRRSRVQTLDPNGKRFTQMFTMEMACRATSTGQRTHARPLPSSG